MGKTEREGHKNSSESSLREERERKTEVRRPKNLRMITEYQLAFAAGLTTQILSSKEQSGFIAPMSGGSPNLVWACPTVPDLTGYLHFTWAPDPGWACLRHCFGATVLQGSLLLLPGPAGQPGHVLLTVFIGRITKDLFRPGLKTGTR